MEQISPPRHLRVNTAVWFTTIINQHELDAHHVRLLTKACEAWDRSEQAREAIAVHGLIYEDRYGAPRARPECAIERDSQLVFAQLVRELGLEASACESQQNALRATADASTHKRNAKTRGLSILMSAQQAINRTFRHLTPGRGAASPFK
jgi:phage terminase small subunit